MSNYVYEVEIPLVKRIRVEAQSMDQALLAAQVTLGEGDEQAARVVQSMRGATFAESDRMNLRLVEVREHEFRYRIGGDGGLLA
jgi:hypothetical protein